MPDFSRLQQRAATTLAAGIALALVAGCSVDPTPPSATPAAQVPAPTADVPQAQVLPTAPAVADSTPTLDDQLTVDSLNPYLIALIDPLVDPGTMLDQIGPLTELALSSDADITEIEFLVTGANFGDGERFRLTARYESQMKPRALYKFMVDRVDEVAFLSEFNPPVVSEPGKVVGDLFEPAGANLDVSINAASLSPIVSVVSELPGDTSDALARVGGWHENNIPLVPTSAILATSIEIDRIEPDRVMTRYVTAWEPFDDQAAMMQTLLASLENSRWQYEDLGEGRIRIVEPFIADYLIGESFVNFERTFTLAG